MKCLVVVSVLLAVANAGLISVGQPAVGYSVAAPAVTATQYHAQDELGQYSYGYAGGPSAKQEVRTADGITRGSYSYIDGYGLVQSASYVSDPINGFRVAATNIPVGPAPVPVAAAPVAVAPVAAPVAVGGPLPVQDTPEVVAARAAHFQAVAEAHARSGRKKRGILGAYAAPAVAAYSAPAYAVHAPRFAYSVSAPAPLTVSAPVAVAAHAPVAYAAPAAVAAHAPVAYAAPAAVAAHAPVAYAAPAAVAAPAVAVAAPAAVASQYHAQDELGQYSYGYSNPNSAKSEVRTADGITQGGYSYVDAHGLIQSVRYVSDPVNGFRVAATNLP